MSEPNRDDLKGMLQALEHMLDAVQDVSIVAGQLLAAQQSGKPLSPKTLEHYDAQVKASAKERARMRELVAMWWTMLETSRALGDLFSGDGKER